MCGGKPTVVVVVAVNIFYSHVISSKTKTITKIRLVLLVVVGWTQLDTPIWSGETFSHSSCHDCLKMQNVF